ncbi:caspase family protein [Tautonia plasticadhaerens]|uniref:Caspase domain protein n=1 Tax=Tautonia plasticadhaerens TaxID=2527974 RepID=A0A518H9C9_9BACT|nr:caspase family protein [Tautonia plasticadhaerens]QDV37460.1 Caspase domain protein [Tautonia plasticadhaerens]
MLGFRRSHAVVVGIDEYQSGIPPLRTAVNDARKVAEVLETQFGYTVQLLNDDATLGRLRTLFEEALPLEVEADDRLLVYFAGHGIAWDGDDGPAGYLVPQDARREDRSSFLPMTELNAWLERLPCRHLLLVLDCCFAGAFRWSSTRDLGAPPEVIHRERFDRYICDPAWQVLTSAAYDQKALDILSGETIGVRGGDPDQVGHSPFAAAFLRGLEGEADVVRRVETGRPVGDGVITATELYLYLRDCVEVGAEGDGHRQTPGLWPLKRHDKGEFIHLVPGHELDLPPAPELDEKNNPYRGLRSYDEVHAPLFFGRSRFVEVLARRVVAQPMTVVLGVSGTGKSSVVKAGLLPHLRATHPGGWYILHPIRPGKSPLSALASLEIPGPTDAGLATHLAAIRTDPRALATQVGALVEREPDRRLVLVVDQFEELITLCWDAGEREQFLAQLAGALAAHPDRLRVVLTLRSDYEPQFSESPLKESWIASRVVVPAMTLDEYREAIEGPASLRVLYFRGKTSSQGFVDRLIGDVANTPGALPLLSFTLSELYLRYLDRRGDDRSLTEDDYEALGGVGGSLRNRAEQVYDDLPDDAHRASLRRVMLRMTSVEGGEIARRRVPDEELEFDVPAENRRVAEVLRRLTKARLIVGGTDADGRPYLEPSHDELIRGWDKLLRWTRDEIQSLQLRRGLTLAAEAWGRQAGGLWLRDPRLAVLRREKRRSASWLNRAETRFVRRSLLVRNGILAGAAVAILFAFSAVSIAALVASRRLEQARQALAAGYLRGLGHSTGPVEDVELKVLQDLDRETDARVRFLFFQGALAAPGPASQLANRADLAVHAAVRFDDQLRADVHGLVCGVLEEKSRPGSRDDLPVRLACVVVGRHLGSARLTGGERFAASAAGAVLDAAVAGAWDPKRAAEELVRLSPDLAAPAARDAAARVVGVMDGSEAYVLATWCRALAALTGRLTEEEADSLAVDAARRLVREIPGSDYHRLQFLPEAFAALAERLGPEPSRRLARQIVEAGRQGPGPPTDPHQKLGLLRSIAALAPRLDDEAAGLAATLAIARLPAADSFELSFLDEPLGALAPRLSSRSLDRLAGATAEAAKAMEPGSSFDTDRFRRLCGLVEALGPWLSRGGAEHVADELLATLPRVDLSTIRHACLAVAAIAPRLDARRAEEASETALRRTVALYQPNSYPHADLTRVAMALGPHLGPSGLRCISEAIAEWITRSGLDSLSVLAETIAPLEPHLEEASAELLATSIGARCMELLVQTNESEFRSVRTLWNSLAPRLPPRLAGELAEVIGHRLAEHLPTAPSHQCADMVKAFVAVKPRLAPPLQARLMEMAEAKLRRAAEEGGASMLNLEELAHALASDLPPTTAASVARLLIERLSRLGELGFASECEALAVLAPHLGHDESASTAHRLMILALRANPKQVDPIYIAYTSLVKGLKPEQLVEMLKSIACSSRFQKPILAALGAKFLRTRPFEDSWALSHWARSHPHAMGHRRWLAEQLGVSVGEALFPHLAWMASGIALWVAYWMLLISWPRLWEVLHRGGWIPAAVLGGGTATLWGLVAPEPWLSLSGHSLPGILEKFVLVGLLIVLALVCGLVQDRTGWAPQEDPLGSLDDNDH